MIFVTGIPRSGTSLCAGLIALSGKVFTGPTIPANRNNPKGFWERSDIRNQIIKPYLSSLGRDPMGQRPLPDPGIMKNAIVPGLRKKVEELLQTPEGLVPLIKEPKLLLVWPPWAAAFPDARWVIVRREEEDILDSVQRTNFMRAYKDREGWRGWLEYHLQRIEDLKKAVSWIQFWPQKALDGDYSEIRKLEEFLGISIPYRKAMEFLEPRFWHSGGHRRLFRSSGDSG